MVEIQTPFLYMFDAWFWSVLYLQELADFSEGAAKLEQNNALALAIVSDSNLLLFFTKKLLVE